MPVKIVSRNRRPCVAEPDGTILKCHPSKERARAQQTAINIAIHQRGKRK